MPTGDSPGPQPPGLGWASQWGSWGCRSRQGAQGEGVGNLQPSESRLGCCQGQIRLLIPGVGDEKERFISHFTMTVLSPPQPPQVGLLCPSYRPGNGGSSAPGQLQRGAR